MIGHPFNSQLFHDANGGRINKRLECGSGMPYGLYGTVEAVVSSASDHGPNSSAVGIYGHKRNLRLELRTAISPLVRNAGYESGLYGPFDSLSGLLLLARIESRVHAQATPIDRLHAELRKKPVSNVIDEVAVKPKRFIPGLDRFHLYLRRGFDAVRSRTEIHLVEVHLQYLVLFIPLLEEPGQIHLLYLPANGALSAQVEIASKLLSDGAAALHDPAVPFWCRERARWRGDLCRGDGRNARPLLR